MKENEKGCVYFFKHKGIRPIKIGYSSNPTPIDRFEQFKTYAPFGAEIIGFIETNEAKSLETSLHLKYKEKRLNGEWFNISIDDVKMEIKIHSYSEYKDMVEYWENKAKLNTLSLYKKNEIKSLEAIKCLSKNVLYFSSDIIEEYNINSSKQLMSDLKKHCELQGFKIIQGKCNETKKRWFKIN